MGDKYLRGHEICALLEVSDETLRRWRKWGIFPQPVTMEGQRVLPRWLRTDVESFKRWRESHGGVRRYFVSHRRTA